MQSRMPFITDDRADPPFAAQDTVVLNGRHKQRVYVVPSHKLVIVRVGTPRVMGESGGRQFVQFCL